MKVDLAKLRQAFTGASAELQGSVLRVPLAIRYGQYAEAVAQVEKIANSAGLTEQQKKVTAEVLAQLKQVIWQSPAPPPQQPVRP